MIFRWERANERVARFMKIPAKQKLEWLLQMNEFIDRFSSKKQKTIRRKLRAIR